MLVKLGGRGWGWLGFMDLDSLLQERDNSCHAGPAQKPALWGSMVRRWLISFLHRQPGLAWPGLDQVKKILLALVVPYDCALPLEGIRQLERKIMPPGLSKPSLFVSLVSPWKT